MIDYSRAMTDEEMQVLDQELKDSLTPEQRLHDEQISAFRSSHQTITATNKETQEREEYYFAEHFNIGPGWMMMRVHKPWLGIVSSFDLTELEGAFPRISSPEVSWDSKPCPSGFTPLPAFSFIIPQGYRSNGDDAK